MNAKKETEIEHIYMYICTRIASLTLLSSTPVAGTYPVAPVRENNAVVASLRAFYVYIHICIYIHASIYIYICAYMCIHINKYI